VPTILMAKMFNKKIILNYRGGEAEYFLNRYGLFVSPFIENTNVIAVPSQFLMNIFKKYTNKKIVILPNFIDTDDFHYRERKNLLPNIIITRQLEPRYNISCALRSFSIIKNKYPKATLKIIGSGSEEERLKKLKEDLGLKDVYFLGALPHKELAVKYDESDIMINTSHEDNFPGSIIEAFACGLPVVTTKVGGIPFMIKDGENGILTEPNDHHGIASGVSKLIETPELAKKIIHNGREFAEKYSWNNLKDVFLHLYKTVS
jgi:glycosyltransferase involved in cell wall biosynthesis